MQLFNGNQWLLQGKKSYKTVDGAIKAGENCIKKLARACDGLPHCNPKFVVGIHTNGQFTPVFFGTNQAAIWFAHEGFSVSG